MLEEFLWPLLRRTAGFAFWCIIEAIPFYWGWWRDPEYPPIDNNGDKLSLTERARRRSGGWKHNPD